MIIYLRKINHWVEIIETVVAFLYSFCCLTVDLFFYIVHCFEIDLFGWIAEKRTYWSELLLSVAFKYGIISGALQPLCQFYFLLCPTWINIIFRTLKSILTKYRLNRFNFLTTLRELIKVIRKPSYICSSSMFGKWNERFYEHFWNVFINY